MTANVSKRCIYLLCLVLYVLLAPSRCFILGQHNAEQYIKKRSVPKFPIRVGKRHDAVSNSLSGLYRLPPQRPYSVDNRIYLENQDDRFQDSGYYHRHHQLNLNPTPFTPPIGMEYLSNSNTLGKRVYDGGYQETLPEVLEDFVPGIKPDDGMCRMEEAFQLLSTNWQDIITLVFKLGLADVGSERK
ncbi:uncharacterized protein [Antedon mediterranea]|uniref:uncharacterized protein isoform X1 n=1 Tax=Antedon mediterranea TaxID=105859 RepID=UPI003AF8FEF0